jgi:hypothetical protein
VLSSKGKALIPTDLHTAPNFTGAPIKIDIPSGPNEGFFVTRIDYPRVEKDERSVVVLRGNFSSQTGILINGTPLTRTVGVANPWLGSEHGGTTLELGEPDTSIKGYFEVVNSNYLVMNFRMPKDFEGVPKITLVTPNRARALNDIQMSINGSPGKLDDEFRVGNPPPDKPPLKITAVQFSIGAGISPGARVASIAAEVNLTTGGVKNAPLHIYFNATECDGVRRAGGCYLTKIADQFYHLNVTLPYNLEKVSFSVVQDKEVNTSNVDNPIFGKAVASTVVYDQGDEEDGDDDSVTITFAGSRVNDFSPFAAGAEFVEWQSQSFSQGVLLVKNLRMPIVVVRLTDRLTGIQSTAVSIIKRPPKKKKTQPPANQAASPPTSNE